MSFPTVKQVAEKAGVSPATVSNVLNRPDAVSEATRKNVLTVIEELGFVRNESARALRVGRSKTIGFLVLDVANPFFTDVARGADSVVEDHGSVLALMDLGNDASRQGRRLEQMDEHRAQGLLVTPVDEEDQRLDKLVARGVPVVLVDRRAADGNRCSVAVDDVLGARLAVEHLVGEGHRRIAFIGGSEHIHQIADRRQGAMEVIRSHPDTNPLVVYTTRSPTIKCGVEAGLELAATAPAERPTAVFCANDLLALGALQAFTQSDLKVPGDVAIVGYDDIDFAAGAAVPLSSVRQPREELGRTAAELLFEEIESSSDHRHRQVVFRAELIVRASSIGGPSGARKPK